MLEKVLCINPEIKHGQIHELFKTDYKVILDDNMIFMIVSNIIQGLF